MSRVRATSDGAAGGAERDGRHDRALVHYQYGSISRSADPALDEKVAGRVYYTSVSIVRSIIVSSGGRSLVNEATCPEAVALSVGGAQ